jgi:hypothetical protein
MRSRSKVWIFGFATGLALSLLFVLGTPSPTGQHERHSSKASSARKNSLPRDESKEAGQVAPVSQSKREISAGSINKSELEELKLQDMESYLRAMQAQDGSAPAQTGDGNSIVTAGQQKAEAKERVKTRLLAVLEKQQPDQE